MVDGNTTQHKALWRKAKRVLVNEEIAAQLFFFSVQSKHLNGSSNA